jgi:hypothetical protein
MNSDDAAVNSVNMMHGHVLEVALDERSLLVRGIDELMTGGDGIWR